MAIIKSLLDTDLYKFTMQQVVLHNFPGAMVEYKFKCRNKGIDFRPHLERIRAEIDHLCSLTFTPEELRYLGGLRFIKPDFVQFLDGFRLNRSHVEAFATDSGELELKIKGSWFHTILFEVPLLSIVNEVFFESQKSPELIGEARSRLNHKIITLRTSPTAVLFSDFGTRRRFSGEWQKEVVETLARHLPRTFTGTSNVKIAMDLGLTPIGTMAHEYLQAFQALGPNLRDFQKAAFETWAKEYRGDLGIALSDIVGVDAFLRDFDMYFCKLFDGARHDSGDPFVWGDKIVNHYKANKVDPATKTLVFSDGLDVSKAMQLNSYFAGRAKTVFGIGTNLTNDMGLSPLNIVIKMTKCNDKPVAKLSDSPGKAMCDDSWHLLNLAKTFDIPEERVELVQPSAMPAPRSLSH